MTEYNYKKGDRVRIDPAYCPDWADRYKTGVIYSDSPTKEPDAGYGSPKKKPPGGYLPSWTIRLDGYDYGTNDTNHHFISEHAFLVITDEDVEEAIASILKGPAT